MLLVIFLVLAYFVSRDVFNRMLVDGPVRFEASGSPIATVRKLLEPRV